MQFTSERDEYPAVYLVNLARGARETDSVHGYSGNFERIKKPA